MNAEPLKGKKVAILVENEYVPAEIAAYRSRFGELGAEVHFMSRLWGQPKLTFVSDVDDYKGSLQAVARLSRDDRRGHGHSRRSTSTTTRRSSWPRTTPA